MTYLCDDFLAGCPRDGVPVEVAEEGPKGGGGLRSVLFLPIPCRCVRAHVLRDRLAPAYFPNARRPFSLSSCAPDRG